jgi:hypothetical protein
MILLPLNTYGSPAQFSANAPVISKSRLVLSRKDTDAPIVSPNTVLEPMYLPEGDPTPKRVYKNEIKLPTNIFIYMNKIVFKSTFEKFSQNKSDHKQNLFYEAYERLKRETKYINFLFDFGSLECVG